MLVARESNTGQAETGGDLIAKRPFGEVHGVSDGEDDKARVAQRGPVEEVVHDGLVLGDQLVQFVHEDDAGYAAWRGVGEFLFEEFQSLCRGYSVALQGFPEEGVGLVRIRDFHAVDFDEDEIVHLVC